MMPLVGAADVPLMAEHAGTQPPDRVLSFVARVAARLCQTRLAAITMLNQRQHQLEVTAVFGTGGVITEKALPVDDSLNGMVLTGGRSFRSPDVWHDRRPIVRAIARRNRTRGVLIVPFATHEGLLGTLAVARRRPWDFSAEDQAVLEDFAQLASAAIEKASVAAQRGEVSAVAPDGRLSARRPPRIDGNLGQPLAPGARQEAGNPYRLTPRERDVMALLMADRTCAEVASILGLSRHTVRHYVERLKLRFGQATLHGLVGLVGEDTNLRCHAMHIGQK